MKPSFYLFRRGRVFYVQDAKTRRQESLRTTDRQEAQRLVVARNEAVAQPALNLALARTYLTAHDPRLVERTWKEVMEVLASRGRDSSRDRTQREIQSQFYDTLRTRRLFETASEDFLAVLQEGGVFANNFLRRLQNMALGLGWLAWPILTAKCWPKPNARPKRGIRLEEHQRILAAETKPEWRLYYSLLWETGAGQSDAAELMAENIHWESRLLVYHRKKLPPDAPPARLVIGPRLEKLLRQLPATGPLFPKMRETPDNHRAAEFRRRCRLLRIEGVSLHSYRYAWAERAKAVGYSERWAQAALGHNSKAVHQAYARRAEVVCPSLEEFEDKVIPLTQLQSGLELSPGRGA